MKQEFYVRQSTVYLSDFDYKTPDEAAQVILDYKKTLKRGQLGRFEVYYGYDEATLDFKVYRLETDKEEAEREAAELAVEADRVRRKLEREAQKLAKLTDTLAKDEAAELALLAQLKAKYEGVNE